MPCDDFFVKYVKPPKNQPKILFFDIETTPLEAICWGTRKQFISMNQIQKDWTILSWSAKWRGKKTIMYEDTRKRTDKRNDKLLLPALSRLLDEADIVVAQNGKRFDERKVNSRLIFHHMEEPSDFQSVDTLQIAKSRFGFTFNSLKYLAHYLGVGEKFTDRPIGYNGMDLWSKCLEGDPRAFKIMEKYNKIDTIVLEKVWERLAPWARGTNYINPNLYITNFDEDGKPKNYMCQCGSTAFSKNGHSTTTTGRYLRWKCRECKAHHREKGTGRNLRPQSRKRV